VAKKQKEENPDNKSKFELALEKLDKAYGKGTVLTLGAKSVGEYDVISSGSIGFDWITLGVGGFVKGKLYEIMGWEGSSKTTICAHAVAECQKKGGKVVYIDGEHAVDILYFQNIGVDPNVLSFSQPDSGEIGFQVAVDLINTGEVDLLIIDSDSSLIPKAAITEGDVGDSTIGKKARLNSNAYPRLKNALTEHNTCVIVISQYREKIGVMFGPTATTQGGHALKYYADCRIETSRSLAKDGDVVYGNLVKIKSTKNKMCPPYRISSFDVIYGKGIDKLGELVLLADEHGIAKKYGKSITYNETKYEIENFKVLLQDNPEFFDEIKQLIVDKIKHTDDLPVDETSEEAELINP
jgi:recombination protein RecA